MKYSPRTIIFCAVSRYLDDPTNKKVMDQIWRKIPQQDRAFISILKQYFDFERMKDSPVLKDDIWIYNFLKYDWDNQKMQRTARLLVKYENEIIIPSEESYKVLTHLTLKPLKKNSLLPALVIKKAARKVALQKDQDNLHNPELNPESQTPESQK